MKIFRMNDCDCWMAETLTNAIVSYLRMIDCRVSDNPDSEELNAFMGAEIDEPRELTEAELDSHIFWDSEDRDQINFQHWKCECGATADASCRWNGSQPTNTTTDTQPDTFL